MKATLSIQRNSGIELYVAHKIDAAKSLNAWLLQLDEAIEQQIFKNQIAIPSLALTLFLSERQFFRKTKQMTGKTPNEYIKAYRLRKARKLLLTGNFSTLKEVAQQVGYKRVDYFSRLFEIQFGIRPIQLIH